MLTIKDLSASHSLDRAAMSTVHGGMYAAMPELPSYFYGAVNAPTIDQGFHSLVQGQSVAVDQSGSLGGFNAVASHQTQNGISGQVSVF